MRVRASWVAVAGLALVTVLANGASRNNAMRIKILDSETHSVVLDGSDVPKNCDDVNFDAYCHNAKTAQITNTMLVEDETGAQYRVSCTVETKWSRCLPLPRGSSFDARREKHGITVYYTDDVGKVRSQAYTLLSEVKAPSNASAAKGAASQNSSTAAANPTPVPRPPVLSTSAAADESDNAQGSWSSTLAQTVRCSFSSTPPGAEVTLDGRYVGSTPSVLGLNTGTHVVVISMSGFTQWKRELTVAPGSELTVNAVLQKAQ
jgi:PEGA domain